MTYAPFGQSVFSENVFGQPTVVAVTSTLTITPIGYSSLQINWTMPGGNWSGLVLVRSSFGTPTSIFDNSGTVLLNEPGPSYTVQYIDTELRSGHFYYYALFVLTTAQATPQPSSYVLAGAAQGLVLTDWGFGDVFAQWMPDWYFEQDQNIVTTAYPQGPGPLTRFLNLLGYEMDWIRSEIESLFLATNVSSVSGALLPALGANYGVTYEPELGMTRSRVLVQDAVYLYKNKGTLQGVQAAASAFSGYAAQVQIGKNLEIQLDDSAFDRSIGHWKATTANPTSTITIAAASSYGVTPEHAGYNPMPTDSVFNVNGYLPPNNINVAVIGASGVALGLTTCPPGTATTLGIPITQQATPSTYVVSAYFWPVTTTRSFYMSIDWYTQSGAFISASAGAVVNEVGGRWTNAYVAASPPAGAYYFGRTVHSSGSLGSDLHLMDAEQVEVNTLASPGPTTWAPPRDFEVSLYPVRQQLITNPIGAGGTTGWSTLFNVGTIAVSHANIAWPEETSQGYILTAAAGTNVTALTNCAVQPGISYTLSFWVKQAGASQNYFNALVIWWNASFTQQVGTTVTSNTFGETVYNVFQQGQITNIVAPVGAVFAQIWITVLFTTSGQQHYIGAPLFAPESAVLPYFDGNFQPSSDYLFEGTANASVSDYYPALPSRLSRLSTVLPDYTPIGSTFSLLVGANIAELPTPLPPPPSSFYEWDDVNDTWDNVTDTWG